MQRGFLSEAPLNGLAPFDTTPMTIRRAMPLEEIGALLRAAPESRRLLYETAFVSGLRANELRNLTINHLDDERCGLRLDATWTKNRKPGFQPLPRALMMSLQTFALSGEPRKSYEKNYRRENPKLIAPRNPLLHVPSNPARTLDRDLKTAGIPKKNPKGKLDFHACRVAYINLVLESGLATPKEVQELARHSTLDLTMNVYGQTRDERLSATVEGIGDVVLSQNCVSDVYRQAVGAEHETAQLPTNEGSCAARQYGSGGRTRTYDQVINSHPLCQLSYSGTKYKSAVKDLKKIVWPPISVKPSTSIGVVFLEGVAARRMAQFL